MKRSRLMRRAFALALLFWLVAPIAVGLGSVGSASAPAEARASLGLSPAVRALARVDVGLDVGLDDEGRSGSEEKIGTRATEPQGSRPGLPDAPTAADAARRDAIDRGLAWLAKAQGHDGSFPKPPGIDIEHAPVGVAALGTLAFLAAGSSPGRGPYGDETRALVDYLLNHVDLAPKSPRYGYCSEQGDHMSRMHGHGFATLALAEVYGMGARDPRLETALVAAVRCIERSQSPEGGWHYEPRPVNHEGSVTICCVQALRAARNAGIQVDVEVVRRAEDYVLALKNDEGFFRYQLDSEKASIALTAAAVATLNSAGRYDDAIIRDALDAVHRGLAKRGDAPAREWPYYERMYLAQAFHQLPDKSNFDRWFAEESKSLLRRQEADGRWIDATYGDAYATAATILVLALPDGLLPIYQR